MEADKDTVEYVLAWNILNELNQKQGRTKDPRGQEHAEPEREA